MDFANIFGDIFGGAGKSAAWRAGHSVRTHLCETRRDLGEWFEGFALACREAREYRWKAPEQKGEPKK